MSGVHCSITRGYYRGWWPVIIALWCNHQKRTTTGLLIAWAVVCVHWSRTADGKTGKAPLDVVRFDAEKVAIALAHELFTQNFSQRWPRDAFYTKCHLKMPGVDPEFKSSVELLLQHGLAMLHSLMTRIGWFRHASIFSRFEIAGGEWGAVREDGRHMEEVAAWRSWTVRCVPVGSGEFFWCFSFFLSFSFNTK